MDSAYNAFHAVLLILLVGWFAFSAVQFWSKRNLYPIKARAPFLSTALVVSSLFVTALLSIVIAFMKHKIHCVPWTIFNFVLGINGFLVGFTAKVLDFCISYKAEILKLKMSNREMATKVSTTLAKVPIEKILAWNVRKDWRYYLWSR
jgi:hypothetical protein